MPQITFLRFIAFAGFISLSGFSQNLPKSYLIVFRHGVRANSAFWAHVNEVASSQDEPNSPVLTPQEIRALRRADRDDFEQLRTSLWDSFTSIHGWSEHNIALWPYQSHEYLEASARGLITQGIQPSIIISSPYLRSIQTAEIIRQVFVDEGANRIEIVIDERLGEWPYAAFGRMGWPITRVTHDEYINITPRDWNPDVLEDEMTLESRPRHLARIRDVLHQHYRTYNRAIIVGHLDTVAAAYPDLARGRLANIEQGGHVIASSSEHTTDRFQELTVYHRYSQGVTWQEPEVVPCNCDNRTQAQ